MRALALAALALAGCPKGQDPRDVMQCGRTPTEALTPCPTERALATHLRDRWSLPGSAAITTTCTPGRFAGAAGWIIRATVVRDDHTAAATFVLQASCGALTDSTLRDEPPGDDTHEAIDHDGDGQDEVLTRRSSVEDGGASTSLDVLRVGSGRLVRAGKIRLAFTGPGLTCDGKVAYLQRPEGGFFIDVDAVRCLATGRHRFELGVCGLRRR